MTKKKTKQEIQYRRKMARKYYHKKADEINRKRRKTQRSTKIKISRKKFVTKTIVRKKRYAPRKSNFSLKIGAGNRVKVRCPIHKDETLHRLIYNYAMTKKATGDNKRGLAGMRGQTNWFYCEKCDIARKVTFVIEK